MNEGIRDLVLTFATQRSIPFLVNLRYWHLLNDTECSFPRPSVTAMHESFTGGMHGCNSRQRLKGPLSYTNRLLSELRASQTPSRTSTKVRPLNTGACPARGHRASGFVSWISLVRLYGPALSAPLLRGESNDSRGNLCQY